jgi:glycosyltransferase involved in cell wall biosynthesis
MTSASVSRPVSTPVVSVLMTAYNREAYLAEAIESVLASDYADFELIIVDDASTDATNRIAAEFAARDTRIRLERNPANLGDYPNRNRAASLARGRYLKYVDSDDRILPHGLGTMVSAMEAYPSAAIGLSYAKTSGITEPVLVTPEEAYRQHFLEDGLFGCGPLGVILRADAFRQVGGFSGQRYIGDLEMWSRLAARHPVVLIPDGLVWWREHDGQEYLDGIHSGLYPQLAHNVSMNALVNGDCPLSESERGRAIERINRQTARYLVGMIKKGRLAWALRMFRETSLSLPQVIRGLAR